MINRWKNRKIITGSHPHVAIGCACSNGSISFRGGVGPTTARNGNAIPHNNGTYAFGGGFHNAGIFIPINPSYLFSFDISDLNNPTSLQDFQVANLTNVSNGVTAYDSTQNRLYYIFSRSAAPQTSCYTIDTSNPSSMSTLGTDNLANGINGFEAWALTVGGVPYLGIIANDLYFYDATTPGAFSLSSTTVFDTDGYCLGRGALDGTTLYICAAPSANLATAWDVSDPTAPVHLYDFTHGTFDTGTNLGDYALAAAVKSGYLYVTYYHDDGVDTYTEVVKFQISDQSEVTSHLADANNETGSTGAVTLTAIDSCIFIMNQSYNEVQGLPSSLASYGNNVSSDVAPNYVVSPYVRAVAGSSCAFLLFGNGWTDAAHTTGFGSFLKTYNSS